MKDRIKSLSLPRMVFLCLQAFLILLFAILYAALGSQEVLRMKSGIAAGETLRYSKVGDTEIYSGKTATVKLRYTVNADRSVEFTYADKHYGPYTVVEDADAELSEPPVYVTDRRLPKGISIYRQDELIFSGFYIMLNGDTDDLLLMDASGDYALGNEHYNDDSYYEEESFGTVIHTVEPGLKTILQFALGPETQPRADWPLFALGVFLCILNAISIFYADELFRWNLKFSIKHPEDAEPSDWELFSRGIGWTIISATALVSFIIGL